MTNEEKAIFEISIRGIDDFDAQCRIQCELQAAIMNLGYECNSENFKVIFD